MPEYWYIWYRVYENGVQIGEGKYPRSYRSKGSAKYRAKQMWSEPMYNPLTGTTIEYVWKISEVYPWDGVKGDRYE